MTGPKLCLDDLLISSAAHFDDAFVISFAGLGDPQDMLTGRSIRQDDAA
jgi:hypothetical protein